MVSRKHVTRLSQSDRDKLEVAGTTPRAIDEPIAQLVSRGVQSFTARDILAEILRDEDSEDRLSPMKWRALRCLRRGAHSTQVCADLPCFPNVVEGAPSRAARR